MIFGGDGANFFSMTLLIGLLVGTYSSVFVASPVVYALRKDGPTAADIAEFTNEEEVEQASIPITTGLSQKFCRTDRQR